MLAQSLGEACRFCELPRRRGSVMCGGEACRKEYYRLWHAANRKAHPERYGRAFYRLKVVRLRAATVETSKAERLAQLRETGLSHWYGATKEQILERMDCYGSLKTHSSDERRFYRDLRAVCEGGELVWTRGRLVKASRAHAVPDESDF